jgi:ABC-type uncharacterized transport system substrate-binding protein
MRLIGLVLALVCNLLALLTTDVYGQASQPRSAARIPTVGVLYPGVPDPAITGRRFSAVFALQEGLRELGYVDGQNIVLMYRWAGGKSEKLPDLAADLVRLKVDVLFAVGSPAIRAATAASRTIPIVAADLESDPVEGGYVASFARPGGNVTGLFLDLPELTGKWLQLVKEVSPQTRRVAVLWDDDQSSPAACHKGCSESGNDRAPYPRSPTSRRVRGRPSGRDERASAGAGATLFALDSSSVAAGRRVHR